MNISDCSEMHTISFPLLRSIWSTISITNMPNLVNLEFGEEILYFYKLIVRYANKLSKETLTKLRAIETKEEKDIQEYGG